MTLKKAFQKVYSFGSLLHSRPGVKIITRNCASPTSSVIFRIFEFTNNFIIPNVWLKTHERSANWMFLV